MSKNLTSKLLIISGPVGAGKTTVGHELSERLCDLEIAHTFVDLDTLAQTFPRPDGDRFGTQLALRNLATVWENGRAAGSTTLIVARVVETYEDVRDIERAVTLSPALTCQLTALEDTLVDRIKRRELGSGLERHKKRAVELARLLPQTGPCDFTVKTDHRLPHDIAKDILIRAGWLD